MPYNLGQFRRNQMTSYSTALTWRKDLLVNEEAIIDFYDQCMYLTGASVVNSTYSYYLRFEVAQRADLPQDFIVKLKSDEVSVDNVQEVRRLSVKKGTGRTTFELIFNPNSTYNQIVFELERLADDFYLSNGDGKSGRIMNVNILSFERITNVITGYLSQHYSGLTSLKKIGIQGPPGMMFVIDGEEIKIGRSGIYELYNDNINITYIGFIVKNSSFTQDGKDYFIMDFKY